MNARWVGYAFTPLAVMLWAAALVVATVLTLGGSATERASGREPQDFFAVSFLNPSSMCEPEDGRAWVVLMIEASGRSYSVEWTMVSDAGPSFVRSRTAEVEPGAPKRISRWVPISETGVSTIRFSTSDGEHDLVTRCLPDDPL